MARGFAAAVLWALLAPPWLGPAGQLVGWIAIVILLVGMEAKRENS
jgi:hypothetical protein